MAPTKCAVCRRVRVCVRREISRAAVTYVWRCDDCHTDLCWCYTDKRGWRVANMCLSGLKAAEIDELADVLRPMMERADAAWVVL